MIAVNGFDFKLNKPELDLDVIRISDIAEDDIKIIEQKLKEELVCDNLPSNLHFVIPDLPAIGFQKNIRGQISDLISSLYPEAHYNSVNIYRALYDEITRKGAVTYDYELWEDLLKKKAITSTTVLQLLEQNISNKSESDIEKRFNDISSELKLKVLAKERLFKEFNRYRQKKIGDRTSLQLETSKTIKNHIENSIDLCNDDIGTLVQLVQDALPDKIKSQFTSEDQIKAAILCEYIMQNENA